MMTWNDPYVSMKKKRKARETTMMMSDLLFGTVFLFFPFWYLDAKGGEEIYLPMLFTIFYLNLACKTIIMYQLVVWTWF
jgi:hypothetical protein